MPSLIIAGFISPASAQLSINKDTAEIWFDQQIGIGNAGIINGPEYKMQMLGASSNPFFGEGAAYGSITYDHNTFHITLLYDIHNDVIVVKYLSSTGSVWFIQPEKSRVSNFVLSGRLFRNFNNNFREILFEGDGFVVVAKRAKLLRVEKGIFNYLQDDHYFIEQSGRSRQIWGKKTFIKMGITKENQRKIKRFINENHIRMRKFKSEDLIRVSLFVNDLIRRKQ